MAQMNMTALMKYTPLTMKVLIVNSINLFAMVADA